MTVIILTYGIVMNIFSNDHQQTRKNMRYSVTLDEKITKDEYENKMNGLLTIIGDELDHLYCEGFFDRYRLGMVDCGSNIEYNDTFTYQELSQGACIADAHYENTKVKVGDNVQLGEKAVEIRYTDEGIEHGGLFVDFRIPFKTAPENTNIYSFDILLKNMPSEQLGDKITTYIQDTFNVREYLPAEIIDPETEQRERLSIACCFGISLIMILSLCYVYTYFIRKRSKQIGILILCGCQPEMASNIFSGEIILYVLLGSMISLPAANKIIIFFDNIYPSFSENYSLGVYALLIAIYGMMTAFVLTQFLKPVIKDVIAAIRKGAL